MGKNPICCRNRKINYLGIYLTEEVKDLYSENYTTLKKEIKEDTNKLKHVLYSWIGRIKIIKMPILSKAIYRFNFLIMLLQLSHFLPSLNSIPSTPSLTHSPL